MPHARSQPTPLGDTDTFRPTASRPVRVRSRAMASDTHFEPHHHPWAQLAYCASGVLQVSVTHTRGEEITRIVPSSRAVWIAPGLPHSIHVLESAELRTLYIAPEACPASWQGSGVVPVSALLRELIAALDQARLSTAREAALSGLILDELRLAPALSLGIAMPPREGSDRRLRALCEAVLREPQLHIRLADWAPRVGASERTAQRLFREELGMGFAAWRNQVLLAHALPQLARGLPVAQVAAQLGYRQASAFTAMFKAAMHQSPKAFSSKKQALARIDIE